MLVINEKRCLFCAGCIGLCPDSALFLDPDGLGIKPERCSLCGICIDFCPVIALVLEGADPVKGRAEV